MKSTGMAVYEPSKPLRQISVDVEEPRGEALTIKIGGAGMCRTDLRLWEGTEPREGFKLPFILGHENAGIVYDMGESVTGFKKGDSVVVYAVWGDLNCKYCREGKLMLCDRQKIPGQSYYYGGYEEFIYVPSYRFLQRIEDMGQVEAAPLTDAGLTSYSAVKKLLPLLYPGCAVVTYGVGGLAGYAIQILRAFSPTTKIIAVSRSKKKQEWSVELGADVFASPEDLKRVVESETRGRGIIAALDLVGNEESTNRIASALESGGTIMEVGMEGNNLSMPTFQTTVRQYSLIGSNYGTLDELTQVVELSRRGVLKPMSIKRNLSEVNEALKELKTGHVLGRYVLTP